MIRKMHLARCLDAGDMEAIRYDLKKRPMEEINWDAPESAVLAFLDKHGIQKKGNSTTLTLWGTGKPMREFLWANDMADACVYIMNNVDFEDLVNEGSTEIRNTHINIGSGREISIHDLAMAIKEFSAFKGSVSSGVSTPDGSLR